MPVKHQFHGNTTDRFRFFNSWSTAPSFWGFTTQRKRFLVYIETMTDNAAPMGFGERLKVQRGPMSRKQLAAHVTVAGINTSEQSVGQWENGRSVPGRPTIEVLERILDCEGELLDAAGLSPAKSVAEQIRQLRREQRENQSELESIRSALESLRALVDGLADQLGAGRAGRG